MSKAASDYTVDEIAITLGLKDNSYRRLIGESHLLKLWEGTTSNDPSFPPLLLPAVEPWQNLARMVSSSELINSFSRLRLLNSVFLVSQVSDLETNGTTVLVSLNRPSLSSSPPFSSTLLLSLSPSKARVHSSVPPRAYPSPLPRFRLGVLEFLDESARSDRRRGQRFLRPFREETNRRSKTFGLSTSYVRR